jgi:hypothetical protein
MNKSGQQREICDGWRARLTGSNKFVETFQVRHLIRWGCLAMLVFRAHSTTPVAAWDFTQGTHGWVANDPVTNARTTKAGWTMDVRAPNPNLVGPPMAWPAGQFGLVTLRMRSTGDTLGQLYHGTEFSELQSRAFAVQPDGQWHDYRIPLPPLEPGSRLRLDPCHDAGSVAVAWIRVEASPERFREPWAGSRELRGKKLIGSGQYTTVGGDAAVTSRYLARNPAFLDSFPFDGLVVPAVVEAGWAERLGLPSRDYFLHELVWNTVKLSPEALASAVTDLNSVRWGGVTDNFLNYTLIDGTRGRFTPNLADDHDWAIVEHNAALAARLCREAKLQGFWLDTEQYVDYRWRTASGVPEFDPNQPASLKFPLGKDTPEVLRRRGAQWIKAVQAELPAVKIMITFAWSPDADGYGPLQGTTGFLNGVLDAIKAPAELIHGYENTFYYGQGPGTLHAVNSGIQNGFPGDRSRYEAARASMRGWRSLSSNPTKYDAFVKVGMAAWIEDDPWNLWEGWPSGSKESLWSNLPLALAYSDEYVWVWSEHTRYGQSGSTKLNPFLASLRNRTFNTGREEASALTEDFATDPLTRGWHFDFDMLAIGRKQDSAHAVPLMSTDTVPYAWDRAARSIRVRGEPLPGPVGQRRRYVHSIQPVNRNQGFHAALDFRVDAFGHQSEDPIVLGLFASDRPFGSSSLTLQIAGPNQICVMLAGDSDPQTLSLTIPGGLKTAHTYRWAVTFDGANSKLRVVLSVPDGGPSSLAEGSCTVRASAGPFAWDELGLALPEVAPSKATPDVENHYRLERATFGQ